ncbi:MAG: hypothetical protein MUC62_06005 [Candidatus Thermoplasmatota archaeon]|nr:hypothetical protein [Candidatus Thermoplasmatota archaeon]
MPRGRGTRTWEVRGVHRGPVQSDNASGPSEVVGPIGCPAGPVIQRVVVRRSGRILWAGSASRGAISLPSGEGWGLSPFSGCPEPFRRRGPGP